MPALEMTEVTKSYGTGPEPVVAVDGATMTVGDDEMLVLQGPSGSGKTTLLTLAGALLRPTSGTIRVAGRDLTGVKDSELPEIRRTTVGFVFQNVNLVPFLTARENLLAVRGLGRGRIDRDAKQRADQLLDELGLGGRAGNLPNQLSGGERQRVAIGRALMNDPALLLVDEPTSALDSALGRQVMELLRREVKDRGVAAVVVTHDERIVDLADRALHIDDGRLDHG